MTFYELPSSNLERTLLAWNRDDQIETLFQKRDHSFIKVSVQNKEKKQLKAFNKKSRIQVNTAFMG